MKDANRVIRSNIPEDEWVNLKFADTSEAGANFNDLTWKQMGHLLVLGPAGRTRHKNQNVWTWFCLCDCGNLVIRD